jgi:16S rRNA (guanine527-N7)-methyltransferase
MSAAAPQLSPFQVEDGFFEAIDLTPSRQRDIETYRDMLAMANQTTNLVGASTLLDFDRRHFIDCAQLVYFEPEARVWADLGSGAGLPGLVLAILMKGRAGGHVHLVESMAKRCRFLADVASRLALPVTLHNARAEDLSLKVEIVTARACAPLPKLLAFSHPYLARGARGLFLKGQDVDREIEEAGKSWRFSWRSHQSLSDPRGRIIAIEGLAHV